jgi:N-acetylglucosaminyl-diphospho-decaprenol L-rhamnosyltransferase
MIQSSSKINISVVIVSYHVKDLVLVCLHSLYKYLPSNIIIETILVDNHSFDGTVDAVRKDFPQVTIIANDYNAGFPAANNQAFKIAGGQYIFMLNPDTEFLDDSLAKLYHKINTKTSISLIAPMLLNSDKSRQLSVWRFPSIWYIFCEAHYLNFLLGKKHYRDKEVSKSFEAECFSGAAILFKHNVLNKIGELDETMFWIEDTEFCYRAHHAGLKLLYYPEARILHHVGQSAKMNYNISVSNQIVNKIKFFKKHHSTLSWIVIVLLSFYHVVLKLIIFGLLSPFNSVYFKKAKAYLYTLPLVFNPPIGMKADSSTKCK